ncbi:MAG TPA: hypothetical protein PLS94_13165 [Prolixibacteraceae bacterium]|nr:hypothetical protein [Prolixibacteraceae bacterium]HPR62535.1 hypothetical protein [Prolixibacteraceae bacterium]
MKKLLFILVFPVVFSACFQNANRPHNYWRVETVSYNNILFSKGETICFNNFNIHIADSLGGEKYKCITSGNRMVIETSMNSWLFEIEKKDSILIMHELYVKNPLDIELVKISNNKPRRFFRSNKC